MKKTSMGPQALIYPMPALLIGTNVDDKPNFMTVAYSGIVNAEPPMISISIRHNRYSFKGISQNMAFSVNVPSVDSMIETDYCGIESGYKSNKAEVCRFQIFYGKLKNAPLIEQCPINLECNVVHILDLGSHVLIIGRIEESYISNDCLTGGKPDIEKISPLIYVRTPNQEYATFGQVMGKAFSIGQQLKTRGQK